MTEEKLDLTYVYDIADGNEEFVLSLLAILKNNLVDYPIKMREEWKADDFLNLRETAHKFKSCTAYTGVDRFNNILFQIEVGVEEKVGSGPLDEMISEIETMSVYLREQTIAYIAEKGGEQKK